MSVEVIYLLARTQHYSASYRDMTLSLGIYDRPLTHSPAYPKTRTHSGRRSGKMRFFVRLSHTCRGGGESDLGRNSKRGGQDVERRGSPHRS